MKTTTRMAYLMTISAVFCGGAALAQQGKDDFGMRQFEENCASCHGVDGKGNTTLATLLRRPLPDLTLIAKNNQGVLPTGRLYEVIDGANVPSHGTREMPIWGRVFKIRDAEYYHEARGLYDSAALVRARILTLIESINRIQAP